MRQVAPGDLQADPRPGWVWGPPLALAAVLLAVSGGYGYHRDELYFLQAGRHLAFGYPDQGPLTPLLARLASSVSSHSLLMLRLPSALMAAATVLITARTARELGATPLAQRIAACCCAVGAVFVFAGHLLSTTTFDLLAWAGLSWVLVRIVRTEQQQYWVPAGLIAGMALLNKPLLAFYAVALAVGLLLTPQRRLLANWWLPAGLLVAALLWSPWLVWQAAHGWPQLDVSSSIASGGSASSTSRWLLIPFALVLVSPLLAPVWIAGLLAPFRRAELSPYRCFSLAWLMLLLLFTATGGKPYYLAGMFPVLLALGAVPAAGWATAATGRRTALWTAIGLSAAVSALISLPLLPAHDADIPVALDPDVAETVGWPDLVAEVGRVYARAGHSAVILTSNYGEAGAVDRFGPSLGLPAAYSGHNGFANWGHPSGRRGPVITVGLSPQTLRANFVSCRLMSRVANSAGIDNDERGEPIEVCARPRRRWSEAWSRLRHLS